MAHEIVVPRLGWSMEEGTFVRWLKSDGDFVRPGEALFELEGEKALQEIESLDEGILRIPPTAPEPGSVVPVGRVLAYLVAEGEAPPSTAALPTLPAPDQSSRYTPCAATAETAGGTRSVPATFASPCARRVAKALGIDWTRLQGTGAGGRIRERDVRAAASTGSDSRHGTRLPISKRRRVLVERLLAGRKATIPVTLTTKADATQLVEIRERHRRSPIVPSFQDLIVKQVADVLKRHRLLAGRWDDDAIVLPAEDEMHLGIAVDTDDGLLAPVIRNVCGLSLAALATQSRELVERARTGRLTAAEMQGGIFTVTNLGAFGIDAFTPVINYPESAILGLGTIRREPVVADDGQIVSRHQLTLSLTFDHRIIDGAPAARFLQDLVQAIESDSRSAAARIE